MATPVHTYSALKGEDEVRSFPPPPNERLPSPPSTIGRFPPPPTDRLPSPPAITVSDTDGSGSAWEHSHKKKATISGVTNDARRVLDSFLNRSFGGTSGLVLSQDCDSDAEDFPGRQSQQEESHYVYTQALQTPKHCICPFNTPQHPPKEKLIPQADSAEPTPTLKKKQFQIHLDDSASSSSTEDYELVDPNELLNRKKKSFFRRATERLMHSFRRRNKSGGDLLEIGELESPKDEAPQSQSACYQPKHCKTRGHRSLNKTGSSSGDNNGGDGGSGVVHSEGEAMMKARKSPLPWKHKIKMKEEPVYSENKGRLLDNLIRGIRKGSFRLKKKGAKEHQRSRSADNLMSIRPLSKEHEKLLRRYAGPMAAGSDGAESDTVRSIHEVSRCRVDKGSLFLPVADDPPPPAPPPPAAAGTPPDRAEQATSPGSGGGRGGKDSDDYDEIDEMVAGTGVERVCQSEDEIDGMLQHLFNRQNSKPFHLQTEAQKELLYEKIAEQLAVIADYYNVKLTSPLDSPFDSPITGAAAAADKASQAAAAAADTAAAAAKVAARAESSNSEREGCGGSSVRAQRLMHRKKRRWRKEMALQQQIAASGGAKSMGEALMQQDLSGMSGDPTPIVEELVRNASYSKFQQLVSQNIGGDEEPPCWEQIARMFRLTQTAVGLAGMGTAVSLHIKEMTIKYFEDKFAGWIVHQGGWESVVEDTNTENDSELD